MIGNRYSLNRKQFMGSVVNTAIDFLENLKESDSLAVKLEKTAAKLISSDPDVQFVLGRLCAKFDFPGQLCIIPIYSDKTLLIEGYVLATNGEEVIIEDNAEKLINKLTQIVLSDKDEVVMPFIDSLKDAYNRARRT